jgi:hypothetical protein
MLRNRRFSRGSQARMGKMVERGDEEGCRATSGVKD